MAEIAMAMRRKKLGTVAGPHPRTAQAGMAMLKAGGNAVDAAVAAAFTEGVVEPSHNGVAGYGGCVVLHLAGRAQATGHRLQLHRSCRPAKWSNAPSRSPVRPVQYRHAPTPEPRWRPTIAETAPSAPGRGSRTCSAGSQRPHIKGTTLLLKSTAFNLLRCLNMI